MAVITVDTRPFERCHHRKPRQPRESRVCPWAFSIDGQEKPLFITAAYKDALRQAKALAQFSVTVLP